MRTGILIALGIVVGSTLSTVIAIAWTAPTASPPGDNVASPINTSSTQQLKSGTLGVNSLGVFGNTILNGTDGDGIGNGVNSYLNFGGTLGQSGYGIRDNNGTLEFKSTSGSWASLAVSFTNLSTLNGITPNGLGQITSIKFGDGTTQTTAAGANPWSANGTSIYYNAGNVGIGLNNPASPLTVNGIIQSTSGGVKFPDGTTQTTAAGTGEVTAQTVVSASCAAYGGCTATTPNCPAGYFRSGCSIANGGPDLQAASPSGAAACVCSYQSASTGFIMTCYTYCIK